MVAGHQLAAFFGLTVVPSTATVGVVSEHTGGGTLHSWLHSAVHVESVGDDVVPGSVVGRLAPFLWKHARSVLLDTASACLFLHNSRIVHGDVRSSNVLVTRTLRCKVGGFGLVRRLQPRSTFAPGCPLSNILWAAPEVLSDAQFTTASVRTPSIECWHVHVCLTQRAVCDLWLPAGRVQLRLPGGGGCDARSASVLSNASGRRRRWHW